MACTFFIMLVAIYHTHIVTRQDAFPALRRALAPLACTGSPSEP